VGHLEQHAGYGAADWVLPVGDDARNGHRKPLDDLPLGLPRGGGQISLTLPQPPPL
jgi:hypothetical protein